MKVDGLSRPPWDVAVQARGLAPKRVARVAGDKPLVVRLDPGAVVTGIVRDGVTRDPVAGARIWTSVRSAGAAPDLWDPDADRVATTSDAQGRFRLDGLAPSPATIDAVAPGHGRASRFAVRPGESVELFLLPGATVSGTVRDEAGRPVPKAAVRAIGDVPSAFFPPAERTDTAGRFAFAGLAAGRYVLVAREGSRAPALETVSVETGADASADLTLGDGGFVTGRLVDGSEKPLAGRVRVTGVAGQPLHPLLYDMLQVDAGADGRFALGPAPTGDMQVEASAPGLSPRTLDATLDGRLRTADLGDVVLEAGLAVRGFVRDRAGAGIGGAALMGFNRSGGFGRPAEATTGEDGAFVLAGLKPGNVVLNARAPGYARAQQTAAAGAEDVELVLDSGGTITGTVVDGRGQGVEGASVTARTGADENDGWAMATADEGGGRFTLHDVRPGVYVLEGRAPGHGNGTASGVRVAAGRAVEAGPLRLRTGGTVRGTVVDATGEPVPGASVRVETGTPRGLDTTVQTDGAGAFEIGGTPTGRFNVSARHPAFAPARVPAEIDAEGDDADVRIVLGRGGRVEGAVRRRNGQPFAGAQVMITPARRDIALGDAGPARAMVADDGSFAAEHVAPGPSQLVVLAPVAPSGPGAAPTQFQSITQRDVAVAEGETAVVDVATREVVVTGRLTRAGEPVAGVTVSFASRGGRSVFSSTGVAAAAPGPQPLAGVTREDGAYELLVFEPGPYMAMRRAAEGVSTPLRDANRPPGQQGMTIDVPDVAVHTVDFTLGGAIVAGIVVDEDAGAPVPRAYVYFGGKAGFGSGEAGPDGRFRFDVEPGEGKLRAMSEGFAPTEMPLTVSESGAADVRVEMSRGLEIAGRVEDASGRQHGDVQVSCRGNEPTTGPGGFAITLPDGSFRVKGLPEGSYTLVAGSELAGYGLRSGVRTGATDVVLTLRPPARLRVRVLDAAGQPVPKATVRLESVGGEPVFLPGRSGGQTEADGTVEIAVPEGSCSVQARIESRSGRTTVDARAGGVVPVDVALTEAPPRPTPPR